MKSAHHRIRQGAIVVAALSLLGCNAELTNTRASTPSAVPMATITIKPPSTPFATLVPGARASETYVQLLRFGITPRLSSARDVEGLLGAPEKKRLAGQAEIWQYATASDGGFGIGYVHFDLASQRVDAIDFDVPGSYNIQQIIDDLGPPGLTVLTLPDPERQSGAPALGGFDMWWPQLLLTVSVYCNGYREAECRMPSASERRISLTMSDDAGDKERWTARVSYANRIRKEILWPGLGP